MAVHQSANQRPCVLLGSGSREGNKPFHNNFLVTGLTRDNLDSHIITNSNSNLRPFLHFTTTFCKQPFNLLFQVTFNTTTL